MQCFLESTEFYLPGRWCFIRLKVYFYPPGNVVLVHLPVYGMQYFIRLSTTFQHMEMQLLSRLSSPLSAIESYLNIAKCAD
ncbi:hypothetical protein RclHR1_05430011 [Rhizophagus clarus]|uniref:Uncharacterized protein n=1 Tax=Rhizophagus clarus TaxID=94130 RepID=A0A2Z6RNW0_9GLOM|nr:hypothetical protein RclHR1_05430011 [Rhizophagus clarus]GES98322.1 hypothetical protein RCL_e21010_RclHR1_05430011 [Rhizophagus clarus]